MKGLLLTIVVVLGLMGKVASVALAIALILWLIGLFGITGADVLRVLFTVIGLYTASIMLFVIAESKEDQHMTLLYKKLKDYILTSYDLSSLANASHKCTAFYDNGEITKLEYRKLMKCIDRVVLKGCKCERIGL